MNFNSLKAAYFLGLTSKFTLFFVWQREYQMLLANENFFPILAGKISLSSNDCRGKLAGACFKLNIQLASVKQR